MTVPAPDAWTASATAPGRFRLSHVQIACYGLAALTVFVIAGVVVGGVMDYRLMKALIEQAFSEL